ncbi:MAG TPA: ester cyclase [Nitrososphaeraceae archaeon]|nr:ester cyclase [Nitrososphaeraceae archaeon]
MKRSLLSVTSGYISKTIFLIVESFFLIAIITSLLQLNSAMGEETTTTNKNNIDKAKQVIEAFNTGNVSNVSAFISPQYFNHESQVDPVRGELIGPEEFIDTIKNLRTAFPDLHHEEQIIISQGNIVISIINVTGTHTGNFFILPPTGKKISYEAVHIYRIGEDGKIVEHKAIRDDLTFLAQLGVIEASSPEYKPFFQALIGTTNSSR